MDWAIKIISIRYMVHYLNATAKRFVSWIIFYFVFRMLCSSKHKKWQPEETTNFFLLSLCSNFFSNLFWNKNLVTKIQGSRNIFKTSVYFFGMGPILVTFFSELFSYFWKRIKFLRKLCSKLATKKFPPWSH